MGGAPGPHLLHYGGQPSQGQAALVAAGDHRAAQLDHDALGLLQLAAVGEGLTVGASERHCNERDVTPVPHAERRRTDRQI